MTPNNRVRKVREAMGLSQADFAKLLDVKQGSLSDIERGRSSVSTKILSKLEHAGVSSEYIQDGIGKPIRDAVSTRRDRVIEVIDALGYKSELFAFSKRIGVNMRELSELMDGVEPTGEFIDKIVDSFPTVNKDWILNEEGSMMKKENYIRELEIAAREIASLKEVIKKQDDEISFLRDLLRQKS